MAEPLLQLKKICKSSPCIKALDDVDFFIHEGNVVVLLGENGAGKSTLLKSSPVSIMPDSGVMLWYGNKVIQKSIINAHGRRITIIFQELNNCPNISALENLFLVREIRSRTGVVDFRAIKKKAEGIF